MPEENSVPEKNATPDVVVVGVLTDPDLPARLADDLQSMLPAELERTVDGGVTWKVDVFGEPFETMGSDSALLMDKARERVRTTRWDMAICLTDLPLRDGPGVMVATVDAARHVTLLSVPSLGGIRLRRRLRELTVAITVALQPHPDAPPGTDITSDLRSLLRSRPVRVVTGPTDAEARLVLPKRSGTLRLLAGMVRANQPWQLVIGLSTALAGAVAGMAFGVLYSNIWQLATALSAWRLAGITVVAVTTLVVWLLAGHGLWERPTPSVRDPDRPLRNAGTVATAAIGAAVFFSILYLLALGAVALIIPFDYLTQTIGRSARVGDYFTLALMATVMGTVAGAVGSGLEDTDTVRKAAYSHRQYERRQRAERERRAREA